MEQRIDVTISDHTDALEYAKDLERRGFSVTLTTFWKELNWWRRIEASKPAAPPPEGE